MDVRRLLRVWEIERDGAARARPVIPGTILYESFAGNGALDNPEALFRRLLGDPEFAGMHHIWAVTPELSRTFRAEFARHPRVRFVRPRTTAYVSALSRSQYLITNATFPPEFRKRQGQTVINTWHGTPLKRMGYDMPDGAYEAANTLRNFLSSDVLLSQNPHMTRMYREAYRLDGVFPGRILELGYPRTDRQYLDSAATADGIRMLQHSGIDLAGRRFVVYAPTWKGTSFSTPRDDADELLVAVTHLQKRLGDGYVVALKAHQAVHEAVSGHTGRGVLISNEMPTNVVLGLADVLVTDYSSIFIDFLSTGRRIVFFTPDAADYSRDRGTYFSAEELPGEVVGTVDALADAILAPRGAREDVADRWRADFTGRDDGHASERVIDAVFRRTPASDTSTGTDTGTDIDTGTLPDTDAAAAHAALPTRRRVLVYLGGMRSNGITTSGLNLLAHLDYEKFDVSALLARPRTRDQRANAARIDPRVRQLHRMGGLTSRLSTEAVMRVLGRLRPAHREPDWENRLWEDEWERCVGDATFDVVIDFSGYSRFWAELLLHAPNARRVIWLHNDMDAEVDRPVAGRRRMRRSLPAVFALYPRFDALVSVSKELSDSNAAQLATPYGVPLDRFRSARNIIDELGARARLRQPLADAATVVDPETGVTSIPEWVDRVVSERDARWFITVGRLSPEKNQARLLDAFAIVHAGHPDTRLLLVGDGPLREELEARVRRLGLGDAVIMTGAISNPFALLAIADCFVLSSDYEGQPMVLLEAAVAGLPIVTVRFGSVSDALPAGQMLIVEQTVDALAQGMRDYLDGAVPRAVLDAEAYNALALREFDAVVESAPELTPVPGLAQSASRSASTAPSGSPSRSASPSDQEFPAPSAL
ncbi:MAG: CDP-glycerol glycerophosphotransferase family protein [Actinomycetota bacterium]|nr:CDP-glycerol glycerophosphotransferase family protein [Actinomycetota bacterium]